MSDDKTLVEQYLAGQESAIEELVVKYQRQIYALMYRMTHNMEDARDLTQQAFIKTAQGIKNFRWESSFKTWLYKIAANTALNHLREARHELVELQEHTAWHDPGLLSAVTDDEALEHVKASLERLPARQKLAIVLRVYEGMSVSEAAGIMGCTEGAVKAHFHNAIKRLKGLLREKGYEINA